MSAADDLLAGLLDPDVLHACAPLSAGLADLHAEERALVAKAVPKRQREFAQGRVLARRLLARLDADGGPLLRDEDRVPRWPAGVVGSISHTSGRGAELCAVAVAPAARAWGVGIDVEPDEPLEPALEAKICREPERRFLAGLPHDEAGALRRAFFCAKESVYKACFPRLRERWGFHDLAVELDPATETFVAVPHAGSALAGRRLDGRVARRAGFWLAAFTLRP